MPICFVIYLDSLCFFTLSIIVLALEVKELKLEVLFCDVFFSVQAAQNQKNKSDQDGNGKADTRHGKLRSLSDILFRTEVTGSSSQEGREDSDYDDEMELDYETSVSGDESRENDLNAFQSSLSFTFQQRDDQYNEHTSENGLMESIRGDCSAFQVSLLSTRLWILFFLNRFWILI
jgi:hypothetical protein